MPEWRFSEAVAELPFVPWTPAFAGEQLLAQARNRLIDQLLVDAGVIALGN